MIVDDLACKAKAGDQDALGELCLHPTIRSVIYKCIRDALGQTNEANDIYADVRLKLCQKIHTWQERAKITNFVGQIARNHCIDILRKSAPLLINIDDIPEKEKTVQSSPIEITVTLDTLVTIWERMEKPCKQLLQLYFFDGLNQDDMISKSGLSKATFYRKRKKCLKIMEQKIIAEV